MTRRLAAGGAIAALVLLAALPASPAGANPPGCAPSLSTGGEWRTYGADLSNTRNQTHEQVISGADAPLLHSAWVFSSVANGGAGDFTGTPIVADGCTYIASTRGWVFAINADTGKLVWKAQLPYGGGVNSTAAIADRVLPGPGAAGRGGAAPAVQLCPTPGPKRRRASSRRHRRASRRAGPASAHRHARASAHRRRRASARARRRRRGRNLCVLARERRKPRAGARRRRTAALNPRAGRASPAASPPPAAAGQPRTAGTVYVSVSRTQHVGGCPPGDPCQGPYVVALDQATGHLVWATPAIDTQPGADMYASPLVYDGILMVGVSGGAAELGPAQDRYPFEGSMNFFDANTGRMIKKTYTIHPPHQPSDDLAGATIWSTPAIDTADKVAFVGAGNPFDQQAESPHADAVLKFDVNRASPHFGDIIGSYKGQVDTYSTAFQALPCIAIPNNPPPYYPQGAGSCGQLDMDFGASPNLFRNASGRLLVGAGQKSGYYHVFDAQTMKPVWQQITGIPSSVGGIVGSTAIDGQNIYGPDTIPGYVWSLSQANGAIRWFGPISDGAHWGPPVAYANGVVYSVDFSGFLDAFDARTGVLLAKRPLAAGGGGAASPSWGAVSIARHTIYASVGVLGLADGFVVALRPGSAADAVNDIGTTGSGGGGASGGGSGGGGGAGGGGGGGPQGPSVVAGPGAASTGFATPAVVALAGGKVSFTNLDTVQHDVTSDDHGPDGRPLFQSKQIGLGETAPVEGTEKLQSGKSYGFYCSIHPGMRGTLIVQ